MGKIGGKLTWNYMKIMKSDRAHSSADSKLIVTLI